VKAGPTEVARADQTMSAARTVLQLARQAAKGVRLSDRRRAFLCAGLGVMGRHRAAWRSRFSRWIGSGAQAGQVELQIRLAGNPVQLWMRQGNDADYLIAGEMVAGRYLLPPELRLRPTAIVDGGANIGVFSLSALAQFPGLPLVCYEPSEANLTQLRRNLTANRIAARVEPKALWSQTTDLFFHAAQSGAGWVSAAPSPHPIACVPPEVPEGCWLKLDIEGAEYEVLPVVLRGATRPALINMELHFFDRRGAALVAQLEAAGYVVHGTRQPTDLCVNLLAVRRP
jgi:FkbM family methyltransferase